MKPVVRGLKYAVVVAMAGIFAASPALADKGGKHEGKHENKHENKHEGKGNNDDRRDDDRKSRGGNERDGDGDRRHFEDRQHVMVREYYVEHYRGRRCPPGLAKKNNGCMPPGQARKWHVGQPLPRDVVYYTVPAPLVVQIGPPPSGHRYVRVAGDILLLAIGTGMVVDAIQDLGGH